MEFEKFKELFELVKKYANNVRVNNKDGLIEWNKLKALLPIDTNIEGKWDIMIIFNDNVTQNLDDIYNYVHDTLKMKGEDEDKEALVQDEKVNIVNHMKWEKMHFMLQLIRIPKNNDINLTRICQIAYNIGQLTFFLDSDNYNGDVKQYYKENKLYDLSSYISETCTTKADLQEVILKLNKLLSQTGGSNYYNKYLKYKNKYIQLRNKF